MTLYDSVKTEELWKTFSEELQKVERPGIDKLIEFLETKTDIKVAPASSKYHSNFAGGLMRHSLKVLDCLKVVNSKLELGFQSDWMRIVSLSHDFCKLNYYEFGEVWDKEHKESTNKWRKKTIYIINNQLPLGHGEKSLLMVNKFVSLLPYEMCAIRWHMGAWEQSLHFTSDQAFSYRDATEKYPLVKALQIADQMSELYETVHKESDA